MVHARRNGGSAARRAWPPAKRARQHRGKFRCLTRREITRAHTVIMLRRCFRTIKPRPELDHIEIEFQYPLLAQQRFEPDGDVSLRPLANEGAAWPEKQVLRGLHRNGARTTQRSSTAQSFKRRIH